MKCRKESKSTTKKSFVAESSTRCIFVSHGLVYDPVRGRAPDLDPSRSNTQCLHKNTYAAAAAIKHAYKITSRRYFGKHCIIV